MAGFHHKIILGKHLVNLNMLRFGTDNFCPRLHPLEPSTRTTNQPINKQVKSVPPKKHPIYEPLKTPTPMQNPCFKHSKPSTTLRKRAEALLLLS